MVSDDISSKNVIPYIGYYKTRGKIANPYQYFYYSCDEKATYGLISRDVISSGGSTEKPGYFVKK